MSASKIAKVVKATPRRASCPPHTPGAQAPLLPLRPLFASVSTSPAKCLPARRRPLIERVRARIANGTYETEAKIDALVPRLTKDLGSDVGSDSLCQNETPHVRSQCTTGSGR